MEVLLEKSTFIIRRTVYSPIKNRGKILGKAACIFG
jgi:hypothetical protein